MTIANGYNDHAHHNTLANTLFGLVAGAVGVWALDRVDWFMFNHEDPEARRRTRRVRPGGFDPAHVAVNRLASAAGMKMPGQPHPAGVAVHYIIGMAPAAAYGALREKVPGIAAGHGSLFGLGLFLMQDEGLNTVARLGAKPQDYPPQAHMRGLISHLVFGLVVDATFQLLKAGHRQYSPQDYEVPRSDFRPYYAQTRSDGERAYGSEAA